MIEEFRLNKRNKVGLVDFVSRRNNLYFTKDNKRHPVKTYIDLKILNGESCFAIQKHIGGETKGLLFVWESNYTDVKRNYIKVEYENISDVDDLLMVLNWNFKDEVYIKLGKKSPLISSFRRKGFKFCHSRGEEILLYRSQNLREFIPPFKEEDLEE